MIRKGEEKESLRITKRPKQAVERTETFESTKEGTIWSLDQDREEESKFEIVVVMPLQKCPSFLKITWILVF